MFKEHIRNVLKAQYRLFRRRMSRMAAMKPLSKAMPPTLKTKPKASKPSLLGELEVNAAVSELVKAEVAKAIKSQCRRSRKSRARQP